jgi:chromosome partitioning protein
MPVIIVGKSTVATNLAGALARAGHAVMLGDVDRQQSARQWLALRPAALPEIRTWDVAHDDVVKPPKGTTHVVLDTPAGLHDKKLDKVLAIADRVLLPLQPSLFDIQASHAFVRELREHKRGVKIGVIGNRVREGTISADQLRQFLDSLDVPVLTMLRDTQLYVHLAARGATLWDVAPSRAERDLEQWQPILDWAK